MKYYKREWPTIGTTFVHCINGLQHTEIRYDSERSVQSIETRKTSQSFIDDYHVDSIAIGEGEFLLIKSKAQAAIDKILGL